MDLDNSGRTRFVILAGLPGTGKTTLAEALAERLGGVVLSKDEVRSALFPLGAIEYSEAQDDAVMSLILKDAQRIFREGSQRFVFLDGRTFSRADQVEQVVNTAREVGAAVRVLHLHCPEAIALQRLNMGRGKHVAADRDADLYFRVKARFEPIRLPKLDVDTSRPLGECVAECVVYLTTEDTERTEKQKSAG
jgi:predicted kinase